MQPMYCWASCRTSLSRQTPKPLCPYNTWFICPVIDGYAVLDQYQIQPQEVVVLSSDFPQKGLKLICTEDNLLDGPSLTVWTGFPEEISIIADRIFHFWVKTPLTSCSPTKMRKLCFEDLQSKSLFYTKILTLKRWWQTKQFMNVGTHAAQCADGRGSTLIC